MEIRQGIDITKVERIRQAAERNGRSFIDKIFTPKEQAYCEAQRYKYEHYAARFAAKEAMMKAIAIRRENRYRFRDIEIRRHPTGKPYIYLSPRARRQFRIPSRSQIEISLAHERSYAIATVLIIQNPMTKSK